MSALGQAILGGLMDATYTKKPSFYNPKTGELTDEKGSVTTNLYNQPSFIQRVLSPTARQAMDENADWQTLDAKGARQASIADAAIKHRLAPGLIGGITPEQGLAWMTASPDMQNQWTTGQSYSKTGAPAMVGSLGGQTDIEKAREMLTNANASLGRNPILNATLDANASNSLRTATGITPLQNTITQAKLGQEALDLPVTTGTQHLGNIRDNYLIGHMPDENVTSPFLSTITSQGVRESGGVINPSYKSPLELQMSMIGRLQNGMLGNQPATTLSSGRSISYNPPAKSNGVIAPTLGSAYSPDTPVHEIIQDKMDAHNDAVKSEHDAKQAEIASKIAELKATQKRLQAEHTKSGLLPQAKSDIIEAYKGIAHQMYGEPADYVKRKLINPIYDTLIGE